jgi:hypothetical protein
MRRTQFTHARRATPGLRSCTRVHQSHLLPYPKITGRDRHVIAQVHRPPWYHRHRRVSTASPTTSTWRLTSPTSTVPQVSLGKCFDVAVHDAVRPKSVHGNLLRCSEIGALVDPALAPGHGLAGRLRGSATTRKRARNWRAVTHSPARSATILRRSPVRPRASTPAYGTGRMAVPLTE